MWDMNRHAPKRHPSSSSVLSIAPHSHSSTHSAKATTHSAKATEKMKTADVMRTRGGVPWSSSPPSSSQTSSTRATTRCRATTFPSFFPREVEDLKEPAARAMANMARQIDVEVPGRGKVVKTSVVGERNARASAPPFVLLHGFDSSLLEYRRLFPKLARERETWAVDVLGWGFTDAQDGGVGDYSPEAKRAHLYAFWKANVGRPMVLCGASLGGACAIDFATNHPEAVAKLVLVDAQGFIEGLGPMGALPRPVAKVGVNVLRTVALRNAANQMAYFDKATYATEDALRVGRLHTFAPQWCDATLSFMQSGGFKVRNSIAKVPMETLVMWGREDKILEPSYAAKFMEELPNAKLVWVEKCGHVAHLEQPDFMCKTLLDFADGAV